MFNNFRVGFVIASSMIKRGHKKTTFFTIFIMSIIFINMIFLPSMINGFTELFSTTYTDYTGSIIIEPSKNELYINNVDSLLRKVNSVNGVTASAKRLGAGATLTYKENFIATTILGVVPDDESLVTSFDDVIKGGEFLTRLSRDEIMLGSMLAGGEGVPDVYDNLGGVKVGSLINVTYSNGVTRTYKLIGIYEGGSELSDLVALVNYREVEEVLGLEGQDKATNILIKVDNVGEEGGIKEQLIDLGIREKIATWQEKVEDLMKQALESFNMLTDISKYVSVLIAVFVLFIVIYINTLTRRREIGILKSIGITPGSIIISYIMISMFYTLMGIALGGTILYGLINYFTVNPIQFYGSMVLSPVVDMSLVIVSAVTLFIMALIAGLIPSWMVTRENILNSVWGKQ